MGSFFLILLPGPLPQSSSPRLDPRGNHDVSICDASSAAGREDAMSYYGNAKKTPGDYDIYWIFDGLLKYIL